MSLDAETGLYQCYMCYVMPEKFPNQPASLKERAEAKNATRDGDPSLAAERKRGNLAFRKRTRAGANWVPRDKRV
jgi:hypothetical protein